MRRPTHHTVDERRRTSRLWFDDGTQGEFFLRGGLMWPFTECRGHRYSVEGAAVLIGFDLASGVSTLFDFARFSTVRHVIAKDGSVEREGLVSFLVRCWSQYGAIRYYAHDEGAMGLAFRRQLRAEPGIVPQPQLLDFTWPQGDGAGQQFFLSLVSERRIVLPREYVATVKAQRAQSVDAKGREPPIPLEHAMICALLGLAEKPWREPDPETMETVEI